MSDKQSTQAKPNGFKWWLLLGVIPFLIWYWLLNPALAEEQEEGGLGGTGMNKEEIQRRPDIPERPEIPERMETIERVESVNRPEVGDSAVNDMEKPEVEAPPQSP